VREGGDCENKEGALIVLMPVTISAYTGFRYGRTAWAPGQGSGKCKIMKGTADMGIPIRCNACSQNIN
jgi:hypothetical protein